MMNSNKYQDQYEIENRQEEGNENEEMEEEEEQIIIENENDSPLKQENQCNGGLGRVWFNRAEPVPVFAGAERRPVHNSGGGDEQLEEEEIAEVRRGVISWIREEEAMKARSFTD